MAPLSRRSFLFTAGAAVASSPAAARAATGLFPAPLYPPADLSYFDTPVTAAPAEIKIGYASITWGGKIGRAHV